MYRVNPEKLALLPSITLDRHSHESFADGHCSAETVAWLTDLDHTDSPECVAPSLLYLLIQLNETLSDEKRQELKPLLPGLIGTAGDGLDDIRWEVAERFLVGRLLEPWMRLAGLYVEADRFAPDALEGSPEKLRGLFRHVGTRAAARHRVQCRELRYRIQAEMWTIEADTLLSADAITGAVLDVFERNVFAADVARVNAAAGLSNSVIFAAAVTAVLGDASGGFVAAAVDAANDARSQHNGDFVRETVQKRYDACPPLAITRIIAEQEGAAIELLDLLIDPRTAPHTAEVTR